MPKVLIVSSADLAPELGRTILWRSDIERIVCQGPAAALDTARQLLPSLVVLDGQDTEAARAFIGDLRRAPETRRSSVAVLSRAPHLEDEAELRRAGANLVLAGEVDPTLWDSRLEELLSVPQRKEVRLPVRFNVWSQSEPDEEPLEAVALNLSVRGLLLECEELLDIGTRLDLAFTLPGQAEPVRVVGQVVREAASNGRPRAGIEMLILRGDARDRIRAFIEAESLRS
jgi:DNA-binding response OmpR family regulator